MGIFNKNYAEYYDIIYKDKKYKEECNFLEKIFKLYSKKIVKILDIASGTGGHSIPLAKRGYNVLGFDISKHMIKIAKGKGTGIRNVNFKVRNVRKFNFGTKFDVAIWMFSSIGYLTDYNDLEKAFLSIRRHLHKNSLLILDFWNGFSVIKHYFPFKKKVIVFDRGKIVRKAFTKLDAQNQICEVNYDCEIFDANKKLKFNSKHLVRFFFPEEIKNYLISNGFNVIKMCPFMNLNGKITDRTWDITVIARPK